jgi:hypothetical protein
MADKNKVMVFLFMLSMGIMVIPFIVSCGKSGTVSPAASNIQMQVVNLSPDLQPINIYVGYIKQSPNFSYPTPSGYFSLTNIDTPIQVKSSSSSVSTAVLLKLNQPLATNFKYTLFVTGLRADTTLTYIFTTDTANTPTNGRSKIRFVNASPRSAGFDIMANGTPAFSNKKYKDVTPFIQIPPGIYDFKIMPTGTTTVIGTLQSVNILDGKVYTLFCRGVAGGADSVAFGAGIINNR